VARAEFSFKDRRALPEVGSFFFNLVFFFFFSPALPPVYFFLLVTPFFLRPTREKVFLFVRDSFFRRVNY